MLAFIVAGVIEAFTVGAALLTLFAAGMSDSGSAAEDATRDASSIFIGGTIVAALIAASHWLPRVSW